MYVNSHQEVIFGLAALGALIAAYTIGVFAGGALLDKPRSRAGRLLSGTGVAVAVTLVVGGLTMGGLWIAGSDLFLKERPHKATAGDFCSSHDCIPNFSNGRGYPVQCADGTWSDSGGIQGACSGHGGEQ